MLPPPPSTTRTVPLFPSTTLFRSPRQVSFDAVAADVRKALEIEQAKLKVQADAKALLAAVKGGQSLADAATAAHAEFKDLGALRRDNSTEDAALLDAAFKLPHPTDDKPRYGESTPTAAKIAVLPLNKSNYHPPPPLLP